VIICTDSTLFIHTFHVFHAIRSVFGINYTENTICRVWSSLKKKSTPSVSGAEKEGVNEPLKEQDQLAWVRAMNNIRNCAEEIVLKELIYGEDTV